MISNDVLILDSFVYVCSYLDVTTSLSLSLQDRIFFMQVGK